MAPGRLKALPLGGHTPKSTWGFVVACFGFVFKSRLRFGWVGKGVDLRGTGRGVNMVKIY